MSSENPSSLDDSVIKVADMTANDHSESSGAGANSGSDKKADPIELTGADPALEQEETAAVEQEETAAVEEKSSGDVEEKADPVVKQNAAEGTTDAALEPKEVSVEEKKAVDPAKIEQAKARYARNRENIKFDPSLLPESDDPEEIRKQVEFYFSDSNLPFDKFLFGLVGKDNRPVALKLICSFKRMQRFRNKDTVLSALQASEMLEVTGAPGEETVKRRVPVKVPEVKVDQQNPNEKTRRQRPGWDSVHGAHIVTDRTVPMSIYAKGFGQETGTTQIDIEKFFEPYGPIASVRLRRTATNIFKGSVFVEFANEELKDKFMALEEKPKWNATELLWLTKGAYIQGKLQDIKDGKIKPKISQRDQDQQRAAKANRGRGNRGRGRGGARGGKGGYGGKGGNGDGRKNNGIPKVGISSNGSGIPQIKTGGANGNAASASGPPSQGVKRKPEDNAEIQEPKKVKSGEPVTTA